MATQRNGLNSSKHSASIAIATLAVTRSTKEKLEPLVDARASTKDQRQSCDVVTAQTKTHECSYFGSC